MWGVGGGWRGPEQSLGGNARTFGLQNRDRNAGEPPRPIDRALLRRAAACLLPYTRQWLLILLCIAAAAGLGVLPPIAVRQILDEAIPRRDLTQLYLLVGAILGINILGGLVGVFQNFINVQVGESILFDLRTRLFSHLQKMSLPFYTATRAGEIVSRVNSDVAAVQSVATSTLIAIVSNLITVLATVAMIFAMNPRLALLAVVIVPGLYLPTRLVGKLRRRLAQQAQETQADLLTFLQERLNIGGMLLTKTFGQAGADAARFAQLSGRVRDLNIRQSLAGRWLFMSLSVFSVAGPALIYAYGGFEAIRGRLTVGSIIAIVAYLANLYRPMANLANVYVDIQAGLAVFERIFQALDQKPEVEDAPGAVALTAVAGHIRFENVGFVYPSAGDDDPFALRDVNLEIRPGERVALVGPSGAGKTTITYLLPRFFDPTSGRITLDGRDLRDISQESLRAHIGIVTQETFLFHATIRENLLYARPDATEDEMIAAATSANIHAFVASLPEGYDTVVGERAYRLSGGERQRLSIARALLKNPTILILDEATSNLDATSEYLIQQALETLLCGRTALIIAHRLSTIRDADTIVALERGRLVEAGSHDQLLARGGLYATLYQQQFRQIDPALAAK